MKRIIAAVGAVAMVAATVTPGMAWENYRNNRRSQDTLNNRAYVETNADVSTNTGNNLQLNLGGTLDMGNMHHSRRRSHHRDGGDATVQQTNVGTTGAAAAAALVTTEANNGTDCDCYDDVRNSARVMTNVDVRSNTGRNTQANVGGTMGSQSRGDRTVDQYNDVMTGDASSTADVWTVVNSSYSAN